jgi:hypothetical protein
VDGEFAEIRAVAYAGSSGQAGTITVNADKSISLVNGGSLSLINMVDGPEPKNLTPSLLSVSAPDITLRNAGITTAAFGSLSTADIHINFTNRLLIDPSVIATRAVTAKGGNISIRGGKLIVLDNSQIVTDVIGQRGNGGNISIQADALVLKTGSIQAGTLSKAGRGGDVAINVQTLIASGSTVTIGGTEPLLFEAGIFGRNVIQASAPDGVSGRVDITTALLDIAGSLRGLSTELLSFGGLGRDFCRVGSTSSLTPLGRGGLHQTSSGLIRPERIEPARAGGESDASDGIALSAEQDRSQYRCEQ